MAGIKETKEALAGLELIGATGIEILKDGKLSLADFPVVLGLLNKLDVLKAGIDGIDLVDDEVKDLDEVELLELGKEAFAMIKRLKDAAK